MIGILACAGYRLQELSDHRLDSFRHLFDKQIDSRYLIDHPVYALTINEAQRCGLIERFRKLLQSKTMIIFKVT